MKYIKRLNLIDEKENKELKKIIDESYHQGTEYYKDVEKQIKNKKTKY